MFLGGPNVEQDVDRRCRDPVRELIRGQSGYHPDEFLRHGDAPLSDSTSWHPPNYHIIPIDLEYFWSSKPTPNRQLTCGRWRAQDRVRASSARGAEVHIPAKVDYAVRALVALASENERPVSGAVLAESQDLPAKFLEGILAELRRSRIVTSARGSEGGYRLARPASQISIADVMRAIDGPLAEIRGERPEKTVYEGAAVHLQEVWIAVRASLRAVLEQTTLENVASGRLPMTVRRLAADPDAWIPR